MRGCAVLPELPVVNRVELNTKRGLAVEYQTALTVVYIMCKSTITPQILTILFLVLPVFNCILSWKMMVLKLIAKIEKIISYFYILFDVKSIYHNE